MGRTLEILNLGQALTLHPIAEPPPVDARTGSLSLVGENSEEIPFIEVGAHGLIGTPAVMNLSGTSLRIEGRKSKTVSSGPRKPNLELVEEPTGELAPLSVIFHSLGSLQSIETATGLIAQEVEVFHKPDSSASKEFRLVASGIQQQLAAGGTHSLLFTSVSPRAGTTTTALNLAITWAKHEKRKVLIIDAAEARAAAAAKMGLSNTPGLADVLKGSVTLAQALQETKQANCWLLGAGQAASEPYGAFAKAMRDLLRQARKQFDLIVMDALPWNDESATIALASGADAVYLVLRQSEAKTAKVDEVLRRIQRHDIFLGGCVITHRTNT
jgi:Mrp family chromosome partitioning ATPase